MNLSADMCTETVSSQTCIPVCGSLHMSVVYRLEIFPDRGGFDIGIRDMRGGCLRALECHDVEI